ncbi:hypothetical protein Gotur_006465, partial [Gossypium turneri]
MQRKSLRLPVALSPYCLGVRSRLSLQLQRTLLKLRNTLPRRGLHHHPTTLLH